MMTKSKKDLKAENPGLDFHSSSEEDESDNEAPLPSSKDAEKVRTKYDRMFQRKNQNVLSDHYAKLVDQSGEKAGDNDADDDDDFITLKRADHTLPNEETPMHLVKMEDISKRKLKLGNAKRKVLLNTSARKKIVFVDGEAHEVDPDAVEIADNWVDEQGGMEGVMREGQKYAQDERDKMQATDVVDRAEAKAKKQEKKRKRKERESAADVIISPPTSLRKLNAYTLIFSQRRDENLGASFVPMEEDDGYETPEFDLPSEDDEDMSPPRLFKRAKHADAPSDVSGDDGLEDDEAMALQVLRGRK